MHKSHPETKILIAGAGAWGTALALQAARNQCQVTLAARAPQNFHPANINPRLPHHTLPTHNFHLIALQDCASAAQAADFVIFAVPTQALRATLALTPALNGLILACKGVETTTGLLPCEIAAQLFPTTAIGIISGPNFAHEIANSLPAASVIASTKPDFRSQAIETLATPNFRLYGNDDVLGAAIGGAAKNVIAIAAGAVTGAGLGDNARAALITRGLAEIARLSLTLGCRPETVYGLSGLGDLVLTCTGPASRNFALGFALGTGKSLADALPQHGEIAEGAATAPALLARAHSQNVEMPIVQNVAHLLAGTLTLPQAISALLTRPRRNEHPHEA